MSKYLLENSSVDGYLLEDGGGKYLIEAEDEASTNNTDQSRNATVIILV